MNQEEIIHDVQKRLFEMQDAEYRDFHAKLVPTMEKTKFIGIRSEEYYVNLMRAWYFATALAKQYEKVLPFLEKRQMDVWTHNKTIQKAIESYRITSEQKEYLRTLRIKK